jgi:hypothetical protein
MSSENGIPATREHNLIPRDLPYIIKQVVIEVRLYNPEFGNDRVCKCGHTYERHFNEYEEPDEQDVGCKYCYCCTFVEKETNDK